MPDVDESYGADDAFSPVAVSRVRAALVAAASDGNRHVLDASLRALGDEARRGQIAPERIVLVLKRIWRTTSRPGLVGALDWDVLYRYSVDTLLAIYFEPRP